MALSLLPNTNPLRLAIPFRQILIAAESDIFESSSFGNSGRTLERGKVACRKREERGRVGWDGFSAVQGTSGWDGLGRRSALEGDGGWQMLRGDALAVFWRPVVGLRCVCATLSGTPLEGEQSLAYTGESDGFGCGSPREAGEEREKKKRVAAHPVRWVS
jgi:hypothetical protein